MTFLAELSSNNTYHMLSHATTGDSDIFPVEEPPGPSAEVPVLIGNGITLPSSKHCYASETKTQWYAERERSTFPAG